MKFFWSVLLIFSLTTSGILLKDNLWPLEKFDEQEKKVIRFQGLYLKVPKSMTCEEIKGEKYRCHSDVLSLSLEKRTSVGIPILGLVRWLRKEEWVKQYKVFSYEENETSIGMGKIVLQQAHINNIAEKVLLRAFDVVLKDNIFVTVEEKINGQIWPLVKDQISDIELSISFTK